jgi:catechol 2,3-dioxygenase-like lactoylglutathione lyase family enzyme
MLHRKRIEGELTTTQARKGEIKMSFQVLGVHHFGLTVRDMKRSFDWYSRMFDLVPGPVSEGSGEALSKSVQVEGAELSFSMITIGTTRIEFLEYHHPEGRDFDRSNGDVGSTHVCLEVSNLDEAYRDLIAKGAVFNAPPVTLESGALIGSKWAYLRDPDGIQLEVWESPGRQTDTPPKQVSTPAVFAESPPQVHEGILESRTTG